ncbi:MAG: hypothetical protein AAF527_10240, partial [Pseudomonadota bacterium]
ADRDAVAAQLRTLKAHVKTVLTAAERNSDALERLSGELKQVAAATEKAEDRASRLIADLERAKADAQNAEADVQSMQRRWRVVSDVEESGASAPPLHRSPIYGPPDDLTRISSVDHGMQERLNALGVYYLRQVAAWSRREAQWVDQELEQPPAAHDWASEASRLLSSTIRLQPKA